MSKHMSQAELIGLLGEWGWKLEETTAKFQRWVKVFGLSESFVLVPNNQDDPHFDRLMKGAQWDLAHAESTKLFEFMMEIRRLPDSTRKRVADTSDDAYVSGVKSVVDAINSSLGRLGRSHDVA